MPEQPLAAFLLYRHCRGQIPSKHFKESFLRAYFGGFAHKPGTTFGTVNAGVCERFIPGYKSPNAVDAIAASSFPDSE